jgi:hypothetical protein
MLEFTKETYLKMRIAQNNQKFFKKEIKLREDSKTKNQ